MASSENITTIVKSSETNVIGPIRGTKTRSYHCRPRAPTRTRRVTKPAAKGTPR
mgnify:CR=1 FL=1